MLVPGPAGRDRAGVDDTVAFVVLVLVAMAIVVVAVVVAAVVQAKDACFQTMIAPQISRVLSRT